MKPIIAYGVCIYRNAFPNPKELIEASEMLHSTTDSPTQWNDATVVSPDGSVSVSQVRTNKMMFTPQPRNSQNDPTAELFFANEIHKHFSVCVQDFASRFSVSFNENTTIGYQVLKYSTSEYYVAHLDDGPKTRRTISAIGYLNDDYEGGELHFQDINFTYYPFAGDIVVFPSGAPYRHEAKPVIEGTKYSIVNWW